MPRRAFDIVNLTTAFLQLGRLTKSAPRSAAALSRDTYRIYNAVTAALRSCRFERMNIRDISDMVMGYRDARHRHKGLEAELFALIKDLRSVPVLNLRDLRVRACALIDPVFADFLWAVVSVLPAARVLHPAVHAHAEAGMGCGHQGCCCHVTLVRNAAVSPTACGEW